MGLGAEPCARRTAASTSDSGCPPAYSDFAFLPFAIGMTLGAAEISPINPHVGKVALGHALLSYVFGTGVLAVAINRVTNLGQ